MVVAMLMTSQRSWYVLALGRQSPPAQQLADDSRCMADLYVVYCSVEAASA
jgi:hypothetical protein